MQKRVLLITNSVSLLISLAVNYLGSTGTLMKGLTVGSVSDQYSTLFTPAGYAFSIWGLIYLLWIAFLGFQIFNATRQKYPELWKKIGWNYTLINLVNAAWIVAWLNQYLGLSVVLMTALLLLLIQLSLRLDLETYDAPLMVMFFVWWPVTVYLGWIVAATVANTAAFFVSVGWQPELWESKFWTVAMIAVAAGVYLFLIFKRNMREAAMVGVWAFAAIGIRHLDQFPLLVWAAFLAGVILLVAAGYHGFQRLDTAPLAKMKRGEWW